MKLAAARWGVVGLVCVGLVLVLWTASRRGARDGDAREPGSEVEYLGALGYVESVVSDPFPDRRGVTRYDRSAASPGVNVYCSVRSQEVDFLDMEGERLHTLRIPQAGEGRDCTLQPAAGGGFLVLTHPTLSRIDWDSGVGWTSDLGHHHDFAVAEDGRIYSLVERQGSLSFRGRPLAIRDHALVWLSPEGRYDGGILLSNVFGRAIPAARLRTMAALVESDRADGDDYARASDVLHPNGVELVDRDLPFARTGDLILCLRELDMLAVLDPRTQRVRWAWGPGDLDGPHHPSLLPNGHLLVFDNGRRRGYSRVLELDPVSREIVWSYQADPPASFYSAVRGSAQALPNGDVLITESTKGRVFEVDRAGRVVWEFWNPTFTEGGERKQIYRFSRLSDEQVAAIPALAARVPNP